MSKTEEIARQRERLEAFVSVHGGRVYTAVPVCGAGLGDWPAGTPVHLIDAVWFDAGGTGTIIDGGDDQQFRLDIASFPATLLTAWDYADRNLLGSLVACRELLSRSYPNHRLLRCVALGGRPSWMDAAYLGRGFGRQFDDPATFFPTGTPHPGNPGVSEYEDAQLRLYFNEGLDARGWLIQEVPVADRRLDGLHVPTADIHRPLERWRQDMDLATVLTNFDVEVIEAKRALNMDVIGQVIAGADLLGRQYQQHRLISQTVVVSTEDPALQWVCDKLGIFVATVPDDDVRRDRATSSIQVQAPVGEF